MTPRSLTPGAAVGIICIVKGYRVRLGDREVLCDLEGLYVLVETKKITVDTEVCRPEESEFQAAGLLPELAEQLVTEDPWSAWEEMESTPGWTDADAAVEDDAGVDNEDDDAREHGRILARLLARHEVGRRIQHLAIQRA